MGHIKFFGIKIADFSMTARITVIYLEMVQQASNIYGNDCNKQHQ
jgi:hypothetical protein